MILPRNTVCQSWWYDNYKRLFILANEYFLPDVKHLGSWSLLLPFTYTFKTNKNKKQKKHKWILKKLTVTENQPFLIHYTVNDGAWWCSGRVLASEPKGCEFKPSSACAPHVHPTRNGYIAKSL